jgi:hypothetical protein
MTMSAAPGPGGPVALRGPTALEEPGSTSPSGRTITKTLAAAIAAL